MVKGQQKRYCSRTVILISILILIKSRFKRMRILKLKQGKPSEDKNNSDAKKGYIYICIAVLVKLE